MGQSSAAESASSVIERLKARFGVESDSDLAARLVVSRSAIANWRNRDRVPMRYIRMSEGEVVSQVWGGEYGDWPEVERVAMRLALMRLIHDFEDVGQSFEGFVMRSLEAAIVLQSYHAKATDDLFRAMEEKESEDAHAVVQLLALQDFSTRP